MLSYRKRLLILLADPEQVKTLSIRQFLNAVSELVDIIGAKVLENDMASQKIVCQGL